MFPSNKIGRAYIIGSTLFSAAVIVIIFLFLIIYSWPVILEQGFHLFTLEWNASQQKFGVLSLLYGSAIVTLLALAFSLPLGLLTALFTSEVLPPSYRIYIKSLLELLAGIPSIVYGLIGVSFLSLWIQSFFDLESGRTLLSGGLLLGVMILPTLITLSDDALHHVPQKYRENARSLGLNPFEVIKEVVLPMAKTDIIGGILLAVGRVLGETMAVMLVIGSIDKIPSPWFNFLSPGQTITSKLGREISEAAFGSLHFSALIFTSLILFLFVLCITFLSLSWTKSTGRLYE